MIGEKMRAGQKKDNMGGEESVLKEIQKNKEGGGTGETPVISYSADCSVHFLL